MPLCGQVAFSISSGPTGSGEGWVDGPEGIHPHMITEDAWTALRDLAGMAGIGEKERDLVAKYDRRLRRGQRARHPAPRTHRDGERARPCRSASLIRPRPLASDLASCLVWEVAGRESFRAFSLKVCGGRNTQAGPSQ